MSKKPGLTLEQHKQLGAELKAMHNQLVKIAVLVGNAYPEPVHRWAFCALADVDELRSALDGRVFKESLGAEDLRKVYYPGKGPEAQEAS